MFFLHERLVLFCMFYQVSVKTFKVCVWITPYENNLTWDTKTEESQRQHVGVVGSYTGSRLHGVSQITHEIAGLVLCLIAARQLSQALVKHKHQILLTLILRLLHSYPHKLQYFATLLHNFIIRHTNTFTAFVTMRLWCVFCHKQCFYAAPIFVGKHCSIFKLNHWSGWGFVQKRKRKKKKKRREMAQCSSFCYFCNLFNA